MSNAAFHVTVVPMGSQHKKDKWCVWGCECDLHTGEYDKYQKKMLVFFAHGCEFGVVSTGHQYEYQYKIHLLEE